MFSGDDEGGKFLSRVRTATYVDAKRDTSTGLSCRLMNDSICRGGARNG